MDGNLLRGVYMHDLVVSLHEKFRDGMVSTPFNEKN